MNNYRFNIGNINLYDKKAIFNWFKQFKKESGFDSSVCYELLKIAKVQRYQKEVIIPEYIFLSITNNKLPLTESSIWLYRGQLPSFPKELSTEKFFETQKILRKKIVSNVRKGEEELALALLDKCREIFYDSGITWAPSFDHEYFIKITDYKFIMPEGMTTPDFMKWVSELKKITGLSSKDSLHFAKKVKEKSVNGVMSISYPELMKLTGDVEIETCDIFMRERKVNFLPEHSHKCSREENKEMQKMSIIDELINISACGKERLNVYLVNHLIENLIEEDCIPKCIA